MELGEQRTKLLDSNNHDSLDFAHLEQDPDHNSLFNDEGTLRQGGLKRKW